MLRKLFLGLLAGVFILACDPTNTFNLDKPFKISYKQTMVNTANNLKIKFEKVVADSRCPADVTCVWAGNAEVKFTLSKGSSKQSFVLNTGIDPKTYKALGYSITLKGLAPANSTANPPASEKYVATLVISTSDGNGGGGIGTCDDNSDCRSANQYCQKTAGDCSGMGTCTQKPEACTMEYNPVCGCDGKTYGNACGAAGSGVNVAYKGECSSM